MKKAALVLIFCFVYFALFAGNNKVDKAKEAKVKALAGYNPLEFIENKGQIVNTEGKAADNVLFKAACGSLDIYITDKGLSYVFVKSEVGSPKTEVNQSGIENSELFLNGKKEKEEENKIISFYRLDMNLEGANIDKANIIKEDESKQGHYNYFYPHCPQGIYNVKAYGKITIKNIYRGIDWVIYCNSNNKEQPIKYDFVVHPQANYKDIKIKFVNADSLGLTDNETKLKISCIAGTIAEGKLYSYTAASCHTERSEVSPATNQTEDENSTVACKYVLDNDTIIYFKIAEYDSTKTLIIDPLVWATSYGYGHGNSRFSAISIDNQDNVYVAGYAWDNPPFPTLQLTGAYWQASGSNIYPNICILKFNHQCVRLWATYYGGNNSSYATSVCNDASGNLFITGGTSSTNFPVQQLPGAYWQTVTAGHEDLFIIKFNNSGVRQWATYYGGDSSDMASSIKLDSQNNIYICGDTKSPNFPTQQMAGAYWQASKAGDYDLFIVKFNSAGSRLWATFYGGSGKEFSYGQFDEGNNLSIDNVDNVYIIGGTASTNFPTHQLSGAYWQSTLVGVTDAFILKFNNSGVRQWATYYGGSWVEQANAIDVDSQNNIFITGRTNSPDFPLQQLSGAYWQSLLGSINGSTNAFILKINSLGVRQWSTYYGGAHPDEGLDICVDLYDNIFVCGYAVSPNFPTLQKNGEYFQPYSSTSIAYISKFSNSGVMQWSTFYGNLNGSSPHYLGVAIALAINHQNAVYNTGFFGYTGLSTSLFTVNPGNGAYFENIFTNPYATGIQSSYILKIAPCNTYKPTAVVSNRNNICANDSGFITLTAQGGSGDTLKWYRGDCEQNYIGKDSVLSIASPITTTTYYARWESLCDTSVCDSITINVSTLAYTLLNPVICQGDSFQVASHIYTTSGIYSDTLATVNGCDSIITSTLTVNPVKQTLLNPVICQGESFQCGIHNYTASGIYSDTLATVNGCDSIITTNLTVVAVPVINFGKDTTLCLLQSIVLDATHQFASYLWQDMSTNPSFTVNQSGVYWVRVSIDSNCIVSDTISIGYEDCQNPRIFIPNSITPDGDGLNDVFKIETNENFKEFKMYIYNRWGEQIFESADKNIGWDGTYKGKPATIDTYVYLFIAVVKETNVQIKKSGMITVIR